MTTASTHAWPGDEPTPHLVELLPATAGLDWTGLSVIELPPGGTRTIKTRRAECVVLPLTGSASVRCGADEVELTGRTNVFSGVTDFAYAGCGSLFEIRTDTGGRFALPSARTDRVLPFRYGPAAGVQVELRGAGPASRQVNNFCTPDTFDAARLIGCEVITPGGNWSSYPPHKHDEERPGESALEEIYYFEVAEGPSGPGVGYQRVYGTVDRPIDILAEVRTGDVVVIPHGWHGPSMASPGYDLYYLNAMAGPGARAWLICDDPKHSWVRQTWQNQEMDPRLPMYGNSRTANST